MAFTYIKSITYDASSIAGDLAGFPIPIHITSDNDLRSTANGGRCESASGFDIGFFDGPSDSATQYKHKLMSYDATTGECKFWVKIDVSGGGTGTFFLKYGDSTITTDQSDVTTTGVFEAYASNLGASEGGMYLCEEDPDGVSPDLIDYSGNSNTWAAGSAVGTAFDGDSTRVVTASTQSLSNVSSGIGNGGYLYGTNNVDWALQDFNVGIWHKSARPSASSLYQWFLHSLNTGSGLVNWSLRADHTSGNFQGAYYDGSSKTVDLGISVTDTNWHYYKIAYDKSSAVLTFYVDGAVLSSISTTLTSFVTSPALGRAISTTSPGLGFYGPFHATQVEAHSDDWVKAEYLSGIDPTIGTGNFLTQILGADPVYNWDSPRGFGVRNQENIPEHKRLWNAQTTFTYDGSGNITEIRKVGPGGETATQTLTYDGSGNLIATSRWIGSTT